MRVLDALRAEFGFALILPAHPRKDVVSSNGARKLTLHDVAGSGAITRGAELVLGLERLSHGYARLRILKDRDGDLPVGEALPLIFERGHGFRLDPKEEQTADDLEQRILNDTGGWRTVKEWARRTRHPRDAGEGSTRTTRRVRPRRVQGRTARPLTQSPLLQNCSRGPGAVGRSDAVATGGGDCSHCAHVYRRRGAGRSQRQRPQRQNIREQSPRRRLAGQPRSHPRNPRTRTRGPLPMTRAEGTASKRRAQHSSSRQLSARHLRRSRVLGPHARARARARKPK